MALALDNYGITLGGRSFFEPLEMAELEKENDLLKSIDPKAFRCHLINEKFKELNAVGMMELDEDRLGRSVILLNIEQLGDIVIKIPTDELTALINRGLSEKQLKLNEVLAKITSE